MRLPFLDGLRRVPKEYRPVAFWFLNHFLREDEIRRQVREMADKGFGGIMIHARDGLRSGYLNGEWRKAITWSIDEAVKHGMHVWLYDELNYPTGPAGGRMFDYLPDSRMKSLELIRRLTVKPGGTAIFNLANRKVKYILAITPGGLITNVAGKGQAKWTNRGGHDATVIVLAEETEMAEGYKFPDPLDPEATRRFVELSYEWYAKEFGKYFGKVIKGEFTDNPCANFGLARRAIPWNDELPERFYCKTGRDLLKLLPSLFTRTAGYREDRLLFWKFIGDQYLENFVIPIDRSCIKNRILSTGHYCLEMAGSEHIRQLGDRFDQKRHQGLPAVDMLGVEDKNMMRDLLRVKGTDSLSVSIPGTSCAAYFFKGSRVMCECLGLAGGWGLDLAEIRRVTGLLAVLGIDLFVPHGIYYSIAGHRKRECIPDHFHNPMWEFYREWTDWISKLSFLASHGERTSQTALLYPANSQRAYIEIGAAPGGSKAYKTSDRGAACDLIDFTWVAAGNALLENNIAYEIIDETLVQSARIEDGNLLVRAANGKDVAFKVMVLPCAKILEKKSVDILRKWRKAGGSIVALNSNIEDIYDPRKATLAPVAKKDLLHDFRMDFESESDFAAKYRPLFQFIREKTSQPVTVSGHKGKIVSRHWRKWGCDFYLLHNISAETINGVGVSLRAGYAPCLLDLESVALKNVSGQPCGDEYKISCDFSPSQAFVFVSGKGVRAQITAVKKQKLLPVKFPIRGGWSFKALSPNVLPLRSCSMETTSSVKRYAYRFQVEKKPGRISLALDCEMTDMELRFDRYSGRVKCCLNGQNIENTCRANPILQCARAPWAMKTLESLRPGTVFDRWIFEVNIGGLVKTGANELVIELSAGVLDENRSCETPLLFGDFAVIGNRGAEKITAPIRRKISGDWIKIGYPYYSGMGSYSKRVRLPEKSGAKKMVLSLGNLANAAEVLVDGKSVGRRILPPWKFDISAFIGNPGIDLEVRCVNTPKNLWDNRTLPSGVFGPVEIIAFD